MAADNISSIRVSTDSEPISSTPQGSPAPSKRPSLSRNSSSYTKIANTSRSMASGLWDFCKYGPDIPDSDERLMSVVPADPAKRKLPWRRWEGW